MFKKVIAGIATLALALGMVALTAGPASAHTNDIDPSCTTLKVDLKSYNSDVINNVKVWLDGSQVENSPSGTNFGSSFVKTYNFTAGAASHTWQVKIDAGDGNNNNTQYDRDESGTVTNCLPDDTESKKVIICHWDNGQGGKWTQNNVSVKSIINVPNGHDFDPNDIIPTFTYVKDGVTKTYPGKNYTDPTYLAIYNNDCKPIPPPSPSWVPGVCTGTGTASAGTVTIPAGPWPLGVTYRYSINNGSEINATPGQVISLPAGSDIDIDARKGGQTVDDWQFEALPTGAKCIDPADPLVTYKVCTTPGQFTIPSYKVLASPNFTYKVGNTVLVDNFTNLVNPPVTITITAVADQGYTFVGQFSWTYVFTNPGDCYGTPQTPQASYSNGVCAAAGTPAGPTVTIFAATGIASFEIKINGGAFAPFAGPLNSAYTLPVGTTSVQVRPIAAANYLPAADLAEHTFASPDCTYDATPAATAIEPTCEVEGESQTPVLEPSFVRLYWNEGIASYNVEGYGIVTRPGVGAYTDVDTGNPLDELTITPTALFGYDLTQPSLTVTFGPKIINQCGGLIGDPTHKDEVCASGEGFGGSIWVERAEGLSYTIAGGMLGASIVINGLGSPGDLYLDGTVPLDAGTYTVTTAAQPGYVLTPHPDNLVHTFTIDAPEENCVVSVELACALNDGGLLLPEIAHVLWTVDVPSDGNPPLYVNEEGPLFIPISIAVTHISASLAGSAYAFPLGLQTSWALQLEKGDLECGELDTLPPIPTNVTHTDQVCRSGVAGGGTVTVGMVDGESFFDETNYYLDGSDSPMVAPTATVAAGAHTVTASLKDPDHTFEEGSKTSWSFTVLAPATCDLTTLALTGLGSNPAGWAGLGYYLLVAGLALIAVRTLRRRHEVKQ